MRRFRMIRLLSSIINRIVQKKYALWGGLKVNGCLISGSEVPQIPGFNLLAQL
jgi:hypothetical protein